ncbi:CDP-diacylglycerol--glycerol-3-phosphate 3-phosphatidyltransferase [Acidilutibacter cellobiosedens]|uniref:CDP-diacylglycerol--glycerol-3-phosphate 3-phosphatidyltransferase n=1 Tax=Acidilutibacter cellobiosedens TaxID=2507161 RepID=A0A410QCE6_9FIRM|nr:CDP-diacylglycerol--glycerol-3-phosphate 3-phosphatidyltransferase [Acidilutibacter cellobiosedens]QAT61667.1 CDP-diacylglycerol--glycerol-3-phosphate 3-phosphatidyltransferase [Acidilutibacter cellobiosedens]
MNLPNKLTIFRICLVPFFVFFLFSNLKYGQYIAVSIFILASLTDTLDGHIARSRNLITTFGKFMDPLADKILVSAAFISLVELGKVPSWIVIIIISRELAITGFRTVAVSEGVTIAADKWGKMKTVTQLIAVIALLLNNYPFSLINFPFDKIMLYISVVFTIISGVNYIYVNRKVLKSEKK